MPVMARAGLELEELESSAEETECRDILTAIKLNYYKTSNFY